MFPSSKRPPGLAASPVLAVGLTFGLALGLGVSLAHAQSNDGNSSSNQGRARQIVVEGAGKTDDKNADGKIVVLPPRGADKAASESAPTDAAPPGANGAPASAGDDSEAAKAKAAEQAPPPAKADAKDAPDDKAEAAPAPAGKSVKRDEPPVAKKPPPKRKAQVRPRYYEDEVEFDDGPYYRRRYRADDYEPPYRVQRPYYGRGYGGYEPPYYRY